jgi:competence protein ComEC
VHFIDVGQADAIFINYGDLDILIDGGNNSDGDQIVSYLESLNTDDIELMVATHPHEDHIGGLDIVIDRFEVEKIIKPALSENTKTCKDFELAISRKNIPVENPAQ